MADKFAPPLSKLSQSGIGVAAAPTGGMGLALDANGKIDAALLKDETITSAKILDGTIVNADISASAAIALSKLASPAFSSYTPTWTTTGVAPAIGNGSLLGFYYQIGKLVFAQIDLNPGTTTTFGTGTWTFTLPFTAISANWNGISQMFDSSAGSVYGGFTVQNGSTTTLTPFTAAQPGVNVIATVPFTWATSDTLVINHIYAAA